MKSIVVIALLTAACKDRGTISIPAMEPCAAPATTVAIYLKPATDCATLACGLRDFECVGNCIALCPDGYCDIAELHTGLVVDPPEAGDYALVMSFRYGTATTDQGFACFHVKVDADGTSSSTLTAEQGPQCCMP